MRADIFDFMERARFELRASESNIRSEFYAVAVSRAYYAMFYAATAALAHFNITRSKHSGIVAAFGEYLVKSGEIEPEFGRMLPGAFDARQEADYSALVALDRSVAEFRLEQARRFVDRVEVFLRHKGELE